MATEISFEPLRIAGVPAAVRIHLNAFPGFFLAQLGPMFLGEFYRGHVDDSSAIAWVLMVDGQCAGVAVGTTAPRGFFGRLLRRRWWAFALRSVPAALARPAIIPRLFRAIRYRGGDSGEAGLALLSSIAVSPTFQARGLGGLLLQHWVEAAGGRGCSGCYLTTDLAGNDKTLTFYEKNGWRRDRTFVTPEGRHMCQLILRFRPANP